MSFILDALKRSDRNRERSGVPGLNTVHDLPPERAPRIGRLLLPYLLSAGLLLNAGVFLWWQFSGQEAGEVAPVVAASVSETEPAAISPAPVPMHVPAPSVKPSDPKPTPVLEQFKELPPGGDTSPTREEAPVRLQGQVPVRETPQPVLEDEAAVAAGRPTMAEMPPLPGIEPEILRNPPRPAEPVAETAPPPIYDLQELPARVRREIPEISFSLHFYTDAPASRLVRIDGRMLREGASLAGGMKIQEITFDGVIIEFRGYNFRLFHRSSG